MDDNKKKNEASGDHKEKKAPPYFIGFAVLVVLAVLTGIEYILGTQDDPMVALLVVIALVKAALIVNFYMHISKLWNPGEEH